MKVTLKNKTMTSLGTSPEGSRSIGAILVGEGRLSPSDVDKIERFAREQGLRFGDAAVQLQLLGVPVLGRIPNAKTGPGRALAAYAAPAPGQT